jgi:hypothetical protein
MSRVPIGTKKVPNRPHRAGRSAGSRCNGRSPTARQSEQERRNIRRFPPEIIRHAIWLYARFTLSFRDVEEMLAERGLDISYEGIDTLSAWPGRSGVATVSE